MSRILITGSTTGLGRGAAEQLLAEGHDVIVHARNAARAADLSDLLDRGAALVVGDLGDVDQIHDLAEQISGLAAPDAVIHNAAVITGPALLTVNLVAPYLLTELTSRPKRWIVLSSGMHHGGHPDLTLLEKDPRRRATYSDSKLLVTTLAFALARPWPDAGVHAVDPGWVPTRMGGPAAPDDLRLGHRTQARLAAGDDLGARSGYWHHERLREPHPAVRDVQFQDELLRALERFTAGSRS